MKRTYTDYLGEYYDNFEDLLDDANTFGVSPNALLKVYHVKKTGHKMRLHD